MPIYGFYKDTTSLHAYKGLFPGIFITLLCECKIQSNMYLYIKVIFENNPTIETCYIQVLYMYLFSSLLKYKIQIVFYTTFYWHFHNYTF